MSNIKLKLRMDPEVIADFRDSFSEHYEVIANCCLRLEQNAEDEDLIDELFRSLHTVKGNTNMCQLNRLATFSHAVEEVVEALRSNSIQFTHYLGEVILLTMDKLKEVSEDLFENRDVEDEMLTDVESVLNSIKESSQDNVDSLCIKVIELITGHVLADSFHIQKEPADATPNKRGEAQTGDEARTDNSLTSLPVNEVPANLQPSLSYFQKLYALMEDKIPYWKDRTERILPLILSVNNQLDQPEDPTQLTAAVYMHDVSYAFLSESLTMKEGKYSGSDIEEIRKHPQLSADWLRLIPGWDIAVEIIEQHHEKWDGSGYPNGLRGDEIRIGAQLLAIVDAYESMTRPRADRQHRRSVLRAVTEINNCSGSQFSPMLTPIFNEILKKHIAEMKKNCD